MFCLWKPSLLWRPFFSHRSQFCESIEFSCTCSYSLITDNKTPVHSTWGLLSVWSACPTPRLNLSSELRPSGNNIQDSFSTGSAQVTTQKLSKNLGKINGNWTQRPNLNQLCLTLHFFIQNKGTEAFAKLRILACSSFRICQWNNLLHRCRLSGGDEQEAFGLTALYWSYLWGPQCSRLKWTCEIRPKSRRSMCCLYKTFLSVQCVRDEYF